MGKRNHAPAITERLLARPEMGGPANERHIYAGGGSIRPYGWQMAEPLAPKHDPIGGKSSYSCGVGRRRDSLFSETPPCGGI
jgi:hypothetical protein